MQYTKYIKIQHRIYTILLYNIHRDIDIHPSWLPQTSAEQRWREAGVAGALRHFRGLRHDAPRRDDGGLTTTNGSFQWMVNGC